MSNTLADWQPAVLPSGSTLQGRFIRLEKLDASHHGADLWSALQGPDPKLWDYLPYGPFAERGLFDAWLKGQAAGSDPLFYTVVDKATGQAEGILSLMSIVPEHGRIEIGHVAFGAPMQRTPKSTEAVYLLAKLAFALGNRRLEWKCNNDNARSRQAAERLGFTFEGVFWQHMIVKGRNRDTAWYSITDAQWPAVHAAFEAWLADANQTANGQMKSLSELRAD